MKRFQHFLSTMLVVAVALSLGACSNDNPPIPQSQVSWTLTLPDEAQNGSLSELKATFTNINSGEVFNNATVTSTRTAPTVSVSITVPEGLYRIAVEGKLLYTLDGVDVNTGVRAYRESVTISGETASVPALEMAFYSPSTGFVIEEIFFTGTLTPGGDQYYQDRYFKIYNNSDQVLYADGLALLESVFLTVKKEDYTPDLMKSAFTTNAIYVVPGSGTEHPVQPGESFVLCDVAIDHRSANPNSFDLSGADFEWYDESTNWVTDVDNPAVPNMDKWYCYTASIWGPHNRGFQSYAIAKIGVDKETFLRDYYYEFEYTFVFEEYSFPMSDEGFKVPNSWIVDAVNLSIAPMFEWIVTDPSLDAGWSYCGQVDKDPNRYGKSVRRKTESTAADGRRILMDTNNSTNDFTPEATPSLKQ